MKYIILESQIDMLKLGRRLTLIDDLVKYMVDEKTNDICDYDMDAFFRMICNEVSKVMRYNYFSGIKDNEWQPLKDRIREHIENNHYDWIEDYFNTKCG